MINKEQKNQFTRKNILVLMLSIASFFIGVPFLFFHYISDYFILNFDLSTHSDLMAISIICFGVSGFLFFTFNNREPNNFVLLKNEENGPLKDKSSKITPPFVNFRRKQLDLTLWCYCLGLPFLWAGFLIFVFYHDYSELGIGAAFLGLIFLFVFVLAEAKKILFQK